MALLSLSSWKDLSAHTRTEQSQRVYPVDLSALTRTSHRFSGQCDQHCMYDTDPNQLDPKRMYHAGLFIHAE